MDKIYCYYEYNEYGDITGFYSYNDWNDFFTVNYKYDGIGRIKTKTEMFLGDTTCFDYQYDIAGRLVRVDRNDSTISVYTYDSNGNRLSHTTLSGTTYGTYDAQDRMLSYGNVTFGYTATGSLKWKAENGDTTKYNYDLLGNLRSVQLPNGTYIQYLIDGQNRRVAKIVNGNIKKRWLYQNQLNIVAELDSIGNLVSRFVYGTKSHVPDYMIKNGITYRFITDHLGSVRFIVDVASGTVVQYITYDEFGNTLTDSNPGFQPFGYAGGLYDEQTDLVRFGARDYNAMIGRWTAKDPIEFNDGELNLYLYVNSESINNIDSNGKSIIELLFKIYESYKIEKSVKEMPRKMQEKLQREIYAKWLVRTNNKCKWEKYYADCLAKCKKNKKSNNCPNQSESDCEIACNKSYSEGMEKEVWPLEKEIRELINVYKFLNYASE
jgi:RHS repeat-associated protein